MHQRIKSSISSAFKFLFSAGIIYWLISTGKFDLTQMQVLLKPTTIFVIFALMSLTYFFANERWKMLLNSQEIFLTRMEIWRLTLIGVFFNFVVPGGVGGDVIKGFYIAQKNPSQRLNSVLTVAMDRLIGLFTMVVMAVAVMIWDWQQMSVHPELNYIFIFLLSIMAAFCGFFAIIFSRRISSHNKLTTLVEKLPKGHHFLRLLNSFSAYAHHKDLFFKSMAYSVIAQIFSIGIMAYGGYQLGFSDISLHTYFFVVPIGFMVTAVPVSPAGVGVGQAAFYYLFNLVTGHQSNVGTLVITGTQIGQFAFGLIGAFYYVTMKKKNPGLLKETPAQI